MAAGSITSKEMRRYRARAALFFGDACYFCKTPASELVPAKGHDLVLTLEHLIPRGRGGSAKRLENHALACNKCNHTKDQFTVEEFCEQNGLDLSLYPRRGVLAENVSVLRPIRFN